MPMFEASAGPRIFACPPGADFPAQLVAGLRARCTGMAPEAVARIQIFVNTRRMKRRIGDLFDQGPNLLLPRIRLVTDLALDPQPGLSPAVSPLRQRLELAQLVRGLIDRQLGLAPRAAIHDLADTLALLLDEMQDEQVAANAITSLDVTDRSGHWQRSQQFLEIVTQYLDHDADRPPGTTERQRRVVEVLTAQWAKTPPPDPILIAGSTGSRGTTALLMRSISQLPQGAVVLPGFDFDQPATVWERLEDPLTGEDHPQFRFARLLKSVEVTRDAVLPWSGQPAEAVQDRNRLVSLALRPAPVTGQWMREGPALKGVTRACTDMTLIEARDPREEAQAIALILRKAAQSGQTAALVTPDKLLTRRVRTALDRWHIEPDVSVGDPLSATAPGRLLRHAAELCCRPMTPDLLVAILKHPLVCAGPDTRGPHLQHVRDLEYWLRKKGIAHPAPSDLIHWAGKADDPARLAWVTWLHQTLYPAAHSAPRPLAVHVRNHLDRTTSLVNGPDRDENPHLWDRPPGREALRIMSELSREAEHGGDMDAAGYRDLLISVLQRGEVRDPLTPHPNIMIWGTLEARVQGADLVVLGGLNDGVWPELPAPDPWLNREMRQKAGMLVPERRIGLSAHDFQQAIAAPQVVLCRATRDAEAETVASRWVNRLTNLLAGMSDEGRDALRAMRDRGRTWLQLAQALDTPAVAIPAAVRPAPRPPVPARPAQLSVTAVTRLIRDPYAIYARNVLRLAKLPPLHQKPDALSRGTVMHTIFERFIGEHRFVGDGAADRAALLDTAARVLEQETPWAISRALWLARVERIADAFLRGESQRQQIGKNIALETDGGLFLADLDFTLTAKADRIDQTQDGAAVIYDYKTGAVPKGDQLRYFDKQLLLEAVMVEQGAFPAVPATRVAQVAHIGLGAKAEFSPQALDDDVTAEILSELRILVSHFQKRSRGYTSRRAVTVKTFEGDYDHLARFGEWDETDQPTAIEVGE